MIRFFNLMDMIRHLDRWIVSKKTRSATVHVLLKNLSLAALLEDWKHGGFGLYLHWPFCEAKCPYCDFNSYVSAEVDQDRWKRAYLAEIERAGAETPGRTLNSVFFGGGTPSLMDADVVSAILEKIKETWTVANDLEVTLEANPSSVEADRFRSYAESGVNRVSLGIQALNDADLKNLGRLHSTQEAMHALDIAKQTFSALDLAGEHLSLYQLTIESGTAFGARYSKGSLHGLPNEDLSADMFELTQKLCHEAGLMTYEVSNHSKAGAESRHNQIYWHCGDYLGIGPGAHGRVTLDGKRYATETKESPLAWLLDVERRGSGEGLRDELSETDILTETIVMGLRMTSGIRKSRLLGSEYERFWSNSKMVEQDGLIVIDDHYIRATQTGLPVLNSVTNELLQGY